MPATGSETSSPAGRTPAARRGPRATSPTSTGSTGCCPGASGSTGPERRHPSGAGSASGSRSSPRETSGGRAYGANTHFAVARPAEPSRTQIGHAAGCSVSRTPSRQPRPRSPARFSTSTTSRPRCAASTAASAWRRCSTGWTPARCSAGTASRSSSRFGSRRLLSSIAPVRGTILFVGAGRHQRRAIERARELGTRVVAVDRNADAPGLALADEAEVVDFSDAAAVTEVGRRHEIDGVMTVASDRAVPVVAAVAEALGLAGIGSYTAPARTHRVAMRRRLAEHGIPQPRFAAVRTRAEARAAAAAVGFPAVLKPADSSGQRGVFRLRTSDDLDAHLHAALAASSSGEAIFERYHEGAEVNTLLVANSGEVHLVTASDRVRPNGIGFGVALAHVYPSTFFGDVLEEVERVAVAAVRALGMRDGVAYPQLLVGDGGVQVVEVAARIPGGQMGEVPRVGTGIDLVEIAVRQALRLDVSEALLRPRFQQPFAISFLTAQPGVLPTGRVRRVEGVARAEAFPGVVRVETYIQPGETIRPVQVDGDRRGYVIALGDTNLDALERAQAASRLVDVEVEA